jgi:phosphatidate cytidylyltransferase
MLRKRFLTALVWIPLVILAAWFSRPEHQIPWFTLLAAVWGPVAVYEFYRITGVSKNKTLTVLGIIWTLLFIVRPHFHYTYYLSILFTSGLIISLVVLVFSRDKEGLFLRWAWMMAGALYVGWLVSLLVSLRLDAGRNWLYLVLFVTFASDSAAYFIGRSFGKRKLAPNISPGKTWEGAAGGLCGAVIMSLLFILPTPFQLALSYWPAIILGIFISFFGQIGDLAESALKRSGGVKDSGNLMPGHGGLLDRIDSVVFAGVVVYLYHIIIVL